MTLYRVCQFRLKSETYDDAQRHYFQRHWHMARFQKHTCEPSSHEALCPASRQSSAQRRACAIVAAAAPLCQAPRLYDGSSSRAQCGTRGWLSVVNRPRTCPTHVMQSVTLTQVVALIPCERKSLLLRHGWCTIAGEKGMSHAL